MELIEERLLICRRREFTLELHIWNEKADHYRLARSYMIAVGQPGFKTPAGAYKIKDKVKDPSWTIPESPWVPEDQWGKVLEPDDPNNPIKARWLGFGEGRGIHGTDNEASLGTAASHGCLRMAVEDVLELFPKVDLGTRLVIH